MSTKREELYRVVRGLKQYLEWQEATGAAGVVPASDEVRAEFEEERRAKKEAELDALKSSFAGEEEESEANDAAEASASESKAPPTPESGGPSRKATSSGDDSSKTAEEEDEPKPWKSFGSRPQRTFGQGGSDSSKSNQSNQSNQQSNQQSGRSRGSRQSQQGNRQSNRQTNRSQANQRSGRPQSSRQSGRPQANQQASNRQASGQNGQSRGGSGRQGGGNKADPSEMSKADKMEWLRDYLGDCQRCPLWKSRENIVFGEGDPDARLVFVGEAPGYNEDKEGRPFVGKAGALLDKMIEAMGYEREDVYICNVLKSRPPNNRNPAPEEVKECEPFLHKQLDIIEPEAIVTLGKPAMQTLLKNQKAMGAGRGRWHEYRGIPVMPIYHPAFLLRQDGQKAKDFKRKTWSDLQKVMQKLDL